MSLTNPIEGLWFALVVACALIMLIRWGRGRYRYRPGRIEPGMGVCGGCGYLIGRGASVVCPECGRDVRRAGLVVSHRRTLPALAWGPVHALWALLCGFVAPSIAQWASPFLPFWREYNVHCWVDCAGADDPASRWGLIGIHGGGTRTLGRDRPEWLCVTPNGGSAGAADPSLWIRSDGTCFRRDGAAPMSIDPQFSAESARWFAERWVTGRGGRGDAGRIAADIEAKVKLLADGGTPAQPASDAWPMPAVS